MIASNEPHDAPAAIDADQTARAAIMLYGAYGYTGELIARLAERRGVALILAGRDAARLQPLGAELGMATRAFELSAAVDHLDGVAVVLHAAGPFAITSRPMLRACLAVGAHYLDITGEIAVFEACARRDGDAKAAGIMVLPGVGFDVVPTDCLAAHVHAALPEATTLALAFTSRGGVSHGTATTAVHNLGEPGARRRGGVIERVRVGHEVRTVDFGAGPVGAVAIPWGDVSTAYHSTGIPNITTYLGLPWRLHLALRVAGWLGPLLRQPGLRRLVQRRVDAAAAGPSARARARGGSQVWAEARAPDGRVAIARLRTPEGYELTADAALRIAQRAAAGDVRVGFATPSLAYGPDLVLDLDGVERDDAVVSAP